MTHHRMQAATGEKLSRTRQRHRLIEACISALHQHGPSRTTIDKVVGIADMSPGIVNFYFDSKAALLLAALDHLALEFEARVVAPLAALRDDPVAALRRLVDLYLDADIASPRKVSVWYSFWGEASSRSEYLEICGKRDLAFGDLVRDLVGRLIGIAGAAHLDADAVALGLIGALEMTWQDIAFHEEAELDRPAARRRCLAYLQSVFPGYFPPAGFDGPRLLSLAIPPQEAPAGISGHAMLVAAELVLAGTPAVALPGGWPGADVVAQPPGRPPQRIRVIVCTQGTDVPLPRSETDWLALVTVGAAGRRFFLVPWQATAGSTHVGAAALQQHEGNFSLTEAGDVGVPARPAPPMRGRARPRRVT